MDDRRLRRNDTWDFDDSVEDVSNRTSFNQPLPSTLYRGSNRTSFNQPSPSTLYKGNNRTSFNQPLPSTLYRGSNRTSFNQPSPSTLYKGNNRTSFNQPSPSTLYRGSNRTSFNQPSPSTLYRGSNRTSFNQSSPSTLYRGSNRTSFNQSSPSTLYRGSNRTSFNQTSPSTLYRGSNRTSFNQPSPSTLYRGSNNFEIQWSPTARADCSRSLSANNAHPPAAMAPDQQQMYEPSPGDKRQMYEPSPSDQQTAHRNDLVTNRQLCESPAVTQHTFIDSPTISRRCVCARATHPHPIQSENLGKLCESSTRNHLQRNESPTINNLQRNEYPTINHLEIFEFTTDNQREIYESPTLEQQKLYESPAVEQREQRYSCPTVTSQKLDPSHSDNQQVLYQNLTVNEQQLSVNLTVNQIQPYENPAVNQIQSYESPAVNQIQRYKSPTGKYIQINGSPTMKQIQQYERPTVKQLHGYESPTINQQKRHLPTADLQWGSHYSLPVPLTARAVCLPGHVWMDSTAGVQNMARASADFSNNACITTHRQKQSHNVPGGAQESSQWEDSPARCIVASEDATHSHSHCFLLPATHSDSHYSHLPATHSDSHYSHLPATHSDSHYSHLPDSSVSVAPGDAYQRCCSDGFPVPCGGSLFDDDVLHCSPAVSLDHVALLHTFPNKLIHFKSSRESCSDYNTVATAVTHSRHRPAWSITDNENRSTWTTTDNFSAADPTLSSLRDPTLSSLRDPTLSSLRDPTLSSLRDPTLSSLRDPTLSSLRDPTLSSLRDPTLSSLRDPTLSSLRDPTLSSLRDPTLSSLRDPTLSSLRDPTLSSLRDPTLSSLRDPTLSSLRDPTLSSLRDPTISQYTDVNSASVHLSDLGTSVLPTGIRLAENPTEPRISFTYGLITRSCEPTKHVDYFTTCVGPSRRCWTTTYSQEARHTATMTPVQPHWELPQAFTCNAGHQFSTGGTPGQLTTEGRQSLRGEVDKRKRTRHLIFVLLLLLVVAVAVVSCLLSVTLRNKPAASPVSSPPNIPIVKAKVTLKILNRNFNDGLSTFGSETFRNLAIPFSTELDRLFLKSKLASVYSHNEVISFRNGSIYATSSMTFVDAGLISSPKDIDNVIESAEVANDWKTEEALKLGQFVVCRSCTDTSLEFTSVSQQPPGTLATLETTVSSFPSNHVYSMNTSTTTTTKTTTTTYFTSSPPSSTTAVSEGNYSTTPTDNVDTTVDVNAAATSTETTTTTTTKSTTTSAPSISSFLTTLQGRSPGTSTYTVEGLDSTSNVTVEGLDSTSNVTVEGLDSTSNVTVEGRNSTWTMPVVRFQSRNGFLDEGLAGLICAVINVTDWSHVVIARMLSLTDSEEVLSVTANRTLTWHDPLLSKRASTYVQLGSGKLVLELWLYILKCADTGNYTCSVRAPTPVESGHTQLTVYARPASPTLDIPGSVVEGHSQPVSVSCQARLGQPEAMLRLMRKHPQQKSFEAVDFTDVPAQRAGLCAATVTRSYTMAASEVINGTLFRCEVTSASDIQQHVHLVSDVGQLYVLTATVCGAADSALLVHPRDCRHFVQCVHSEVSVLSCGTGLCFNVRSQQCDIDTLTTSSSVMEEKCARNTDMEFLPHPSLCNKYILCDVGSKVTQHCPQGQLYVKDGLCTSDVHEAWCYKVLRL